MASAGAAGDASPQARTQRKQALLHIERFFGLVSLLSHHIVGGYCDDVVRRGIRCQRDTHGSRNVAFGIETVAPFHVASSSRLHASILDQSTPLSWAPHRFVPRYADRETNRVLSPSVYRRFRRAVECFGRVPAAHPELD